MQPYTVLTIINAILALAIAYAAWRQKATPGALPLAVVLLAATVWLVTSVFESLAVNLPWKIFWSKLSYLGVVIGPTFFLVFTIVYSGYYNWLKTRSQFLLGIIPFVTICLVMTNEAHHLIWTGFQPGPPGTHVILYEHGPGFWLITFYFYFLLMIGSLLLVQAVLRFPMTYRLQTLALLAGVITPWMGGIVYLFGTNLVQGVDILPMVIALMGLLMLGTTLQLHLLELAPIAHETIMETMRDGVIVLDSLGRVKEMNEAAARFLNVSKNLAVGKPSHKVFQNWEDLLRHNIDDTQPRSFTITNLKTILFINYTPLYDPHGRLNGRLLLLNDITAYKQAEEAERQLRSLAEALANTASALNKSLDLENVLDRILSHVGQVVPHDAADIMLLEEDGKIARLVRFVPHTTDISTHPQAVVGKAYVVKEDIHLQKMLTSRKPLILSDTHQEIGWVALPETAWVRSVLGAPIQAQDKVYGFLNLTSSKPSFFRPEQANSLQVFADQAALAICNARSYIEIQQRAEELEVLYHVGLTITAGLDMDAVMRAIHEQCAQVLSMDVFYIAIYDPNTYQIETPYYWENGKTGSTPPRDLRRNPGLTGYVIENRGTLYLPDATDLDIKLPVQIIHHGNGITRTYVGIPLMLRGEVIGVLSIQSYLPDAYSANQLRLMETIASQAAVAVENARLYARMEQMAIMDELTGIYNFRGLNLFGLREIERAKRFERPLSALFMDIDHFRKFNNQYGHTTGNQVLHSVAQLFRTTLRMVDMLARYGGEEFVVLLPETHLIEAIEVAERLRIAVSEEKFITEYGLLSVTISIGVSELNQEQRSLEALIDAANQAERQAKALGRNRVESMS